MRDLSFADRYKTQITRSSTHIYLAPHPSLRPLIAHYTLCLAAPAPGVTHGALLSLLPDASGCLVFTLLPDGLEGRMYGPTTESVTVQNDLGLCPLRFFVEFRPGGLYTVTGIPQHELTDRVWPLGDVAPELGRGVARAFYRAPDLDEFVRRVDRILCARPRYSARSAAMLSYLARAQGPSPVTALSQASGYSPRQLSRLFLEGVGMGAKAYARVVRINRAAQLLRAGEDSLTRLAQDAGYYDQSHFIRDFKSVAGVTPGVYRAGLTDFYNEPLKFE